MLTHRKLVALQAIAQTPGLGVNRLASTLAVRQPTASQVVKALQSLNLIDVTRDDRDRRAVHLHVNEDGLALLRVMRAQLSRPAERRDQRTPASL